MTKTFAELFTSCVERPISAQELFVTHCLVRLEPQNMHNSSEFDIRPFYFDKDLSLKSLAIIYSPNSLPNFLREDLISSQ